MRWRLARPTLLSAYIRPRRTKAEQCKPGFRQFAPLNPIELHAGASTFLTCFRVVPHQGKAEPSAVCRDLMVVDNDPGVRSVSMRGCELRRVFRWRHLSRSSFLVPNVNGRYALGDQAVLAFMPNPFPTIEQVAHRLRGHRRIRFCQALADLTPLVRNFMSVAPLLVGAVNRQRQISN